MQAARYGAPLGLPKDGAKLYLPDEAYPRFPLPPGATGQLRLMEVRGLPIRPNWDKTRQEPAEAFFLARASFSASSATSSPILLRCLKQSATVLATL